MAVDDPTTGNPAPENNGSAVDESLLSPEDQAEGAPAGGEGQDGTVQETGNPADKGGDAPLLEPEEGEKPEENPDTGAPESYSEFALPEGFTMDESVAEETTGMFRQLNLSQQGAQKLIDFYTQRVIAQKERDLADLGQRRTNWRKEVRQRPNFEEERALAKRGMREVVNTPEEKALFKDSWMSDHPAVFGMFVKIGRLLGEDTPLPNGSAGGVPGSADEARFPIKL